MASFSWQNLFQSAHEWYVKIRNSDLVVPPPELRRGGKALTTFVTNGTLMVERCVRWAGLHSGSSILDVGCGDGRFASCLTRVLTKGTYVGFDVGQRYVNFLGEHLSKKHPHFRFVHADLWHSYYNPTGKCKTSEYRFPVDDASMDIVFLNSIFTHFLPHEVEHYLSECARVLKTGGVLLCTYFLVNDEAIQMDAAGMSEESVRLTCPRVLNHRGEHYWSRNEDVKEYIVGLDEDWVRSAYEANGLGIDKVLPGTWCGRKKTPVNTQQDILVARKQLAA